MIIRSWKSIAKKLSGEGPIMDLRTAKRIAELYRLPVIKLGQSVCISEQVFDKWLEEINLAPYQENNSKKV